MEPLTRKQLRALDATALAMGFSTLQLMERAGQRAAAIIKERYGAQHYLIMVGPGNNGGDGLVVARELANKGYRTSVLLASAKLSEAAQHNLRIAEHMNIPVHHYDDTFSLTPYDVLIDALLGYSQKEPLRGTVLKMVEAANNSNKPVIALDVPTGLDCTSGEILGTVLRADLTLSFAAPKKGFERGKTFCGEIITIGIGIPALVYTQLGLSTYLIDGPE